MARMRSQSLGDTSSAGSPPANQPIGTTIPEGTTVFTCTTAPNSTSARAPRRAPLNSTAPVAIRASPSITHPVRCVWTDHHVVADPNRMALDAADNRVLHDDAIRADLHRAAFGRDHRAEQHPTVGTHRDIAAENSGRSNVGR